MRDLKAIADGVVATIKTYIKTAHDGLAVRIDAVEAQVKSIPAGPKGDKGDKGDPGVGMKGDKGDPPDPEIVKEMVSAAVASIPKPKDGEHGKDADPAPIAAKLEADLAENVERLRRELAAAVAALPVPKDGASVTVEDVKPLVLEEVTKAVAAIPKPKDGESVHPDTIARLVAERVAQEIKSLPVPKDGEPGRDALQLELAPSIDEKKSYPRGTYASHMGGIIRAVRKTDPVVDGDILAAGWMVAVEGNAPPVIEISTDQRTIKFTTVATSGTKAVTEFNVPAMLYRGIWQEAQFKQGDVVTWGGSGWIAERDTDRKPGEPDSGWRLFVKAGRDFRPKDGEPPQRGPVKL